MTQKIGDLTTDEFRALIQETVRQTIREMLKTEPETAARLRKLSDSDAPPSPSRERLLDEPFGGIPRGLED